MLSTSPSLSVVAGLATGIAFVILFATVENTASNNDSNAPDTNEKDRAVVPDKFTIVYSYGVGLDYTLTVNNTAIGKFTAKNCSSKTPTLHATFAISQQEMESVWKAINENDFFSLSDLTEECPPLTISCRGIHPEKKIELQIVTDSDANNVEFRQNYSLNHNTDELKRFKAIVTTIDEVISHYDLPKSACAYA